MQAKKTKDEFRVTALYARLSHDDNLNGDSCSIVHQKEILNNYALMHGYFNCRFYVDDGYSGLNFNRPDFQKMIADIKKGLIGTVIVKDLSRFGRNYVLVGTYTDIIFPEYDVHFISVNDGVDSAKGENEYAAFHNIINEFYARDISQKQRAVVQSRGNNGQRLTTKAIYGYLKDENKNWIIDDEAADVVKKIFDMYLHGKGTQEIANALFAAEIIVPSVHTNSVRKGSYAEHNPYMWSAQTVRGILSRQEYCGDTINFKTEKVSYKDHRVIKHDKEDYKVFRDTQPAIISREDFERVQELLSKKKRAVPIEENPIFNSIVYCADCKSRMHLMRSRSYKETRPDCYVCSGYRKKIKQCKSHYIRESVLYDEVLLKIRLAVNENASDPNAFAKRINALLKKRESSNKKETKKCIQEKQNRVDEINKIIARLYEDRIKGSDMDKIFCELSVQYDKERSELREEITKLTERLCDEKFSSHNIDRFFKAISQYTHVDKLDTDILYNLIDRIEVHEGVEIPGKRVKECKIDVFFIGVGMIEE